MILTQIRYFVEICWDILSLIFVSGVFKFQERNKTIRRWYKEAETQSHCRTQEVVNSPVRCCDDFPPSFSLPSSPWWKTSPIWWWLGEDGWCWSATLCRSHSGSTDCCWCPVCSWISSVWNAGKEEFITFMHQHFEASFYDISEDSEKCAELLFVRDQNCEKKKKHKKHTFS